MSQQHLSKPHAPRGTPQSLDPHEHREVLLQTLWRYQEEDRLGFPEDVEFCFLTGLNWTEFTETRDILLAEENPRLIRDHTGRLALTW